MINSSFSRPVTFLQYLSCPQHPRNSLQYDGIFQVLLSFHNAAENWVLFPATEFRALSQQVEASRSEGTEYHVETEGTLICLRVHLSNRIFKCSCMLKAGIEKTGKFLSNIQSSMNTCKEWFVFQKEQSLYWEMWCCTWEKM